MLYFHINGYKNKIRQFTSINTALSYIKRYPSITRRYYTFSVYKENSDENGTYIYKGKKNSTIVPKNTQRPNKYKYKVCNASIERINYFPVKNNFIDIFDTCLNDRHCIRNKILYSFWKTRFGIDYRGNASQITSLNELFKYVLKNLNNAIPLNKSFIGRPVFGKRDFYEIYNTAISDDRYNIVNVNIDAIRYSLASNKYRDINSYSHMPQINIYDPKVILVYDADRRKPVSIKASKIFLNAIQTCKFKLGESATIYCAEEFQHMWESYVINVTSNMKLVVDDDFQFIYDSKNYGGAIVSCMSNRNRHSCYNHFTAKAASLRDQNNKILSRCIVFENVKLVADKTIHKYAERQYSIEGNPLYSSVLVKKLIKEYGVTLYKAVGAGAGDCRCVLDANGNALPDSRLEIECKFENGDILSYQDTFKFHYYNENIARNFVINSNYAELGRTIEFYQRTR